MAASGFIIPDRQVGCKDNSPFRGLSPGTKRESVPKRTDSLKVLNKDILYLFSHSLAALCAKCFSLVHAAGKTTGLYFAPAGAKLLRRLFDSLKKSAPYGTDSLQ